MKMGHISCMSTMPGTVLGTWDIVINRTDKLTAIMELIININKEGLKIVHVTPDVQAGFRKGRGPEIKLPTPNLIIEKSREFQKNICFTDQGKDFDCVDHNCGKFLKRWEYQTTLPAS